MSLSCLNGRKQYLTPSSEDPAANQARILPANERVSRNPSSLWATVSSPILPAQAQSLGWHSSCASLRLSEERGGQSLSWDVAHQGCPCAQLPVRAAQLCLCAQQQGQGRGERCEVKYTAHIKHSSHSLLCPGTAFTRPWQGLDPLHNPRPGRELESLQNK